MALPVGQQTAGSTRLDNSTKQFNAQRASAGPGGNSAALSFMRAQSGPPAVHNKSMAVGAANNGTPTPSPVVNLNQITAGAGPVQAGMTAAPNNTMPPQSRLRPNPSPKLDIEDVKRQQQVTDLFTSPLVQTAVVRTRLQDYYKRKNNPGAAAPERDLGSFAENVVANLIGPHDGDTNGSD